MGCQLGCFRRANWAVTVSLLHLQYSTHSRVATRPPLDTLPLGDPQFNRACTPAGISLLLCCACRCTHTTCPLGMLHLAQQRALYSEQVDILANGALLRSTHLNSTRKLDRAISICVPSCDVRLNAAASIIQCASANLAVVQSWTQVDSV